jgi:hypothetical protein
MGTCWHRVFNASAPDGFMMPNDFTNDKGKKLFGKLWIKFSSNRKLAEAGDLLRLSAGVRRRQICAEPSELQLSGYTGSAPPTCG